jgi:hypothetical protein
MKLTLLNPTKNVNENKQDAVWGVAPKSSYCLKKLDFLKP